SCPDHAQFLHSLYTSALRPPPTSPLPPSTSLFRSDVSAYTNKFQPAAPHLPQLHHFCAPPTLPTTAKSSNFVHFAEICTIFELSPDIRLTTASIFPTYCN